MNITIIHEDEFILVCDKPAGLMVEPDRNQNPSLLNELKNKIKVSGNKGEEFYLQHLHRIDRPVSGLVLFARNKETLHFLSNQFAERTIKKKYIALTDNAPHEIQGQLSHWHRKEKKKAIIYNEEIIYSESVSLTYKVKKDNKLYKWEIDLHTGKFHQIRAQLAFIGCPILGDDKYGSEKIYKPNELALVAKELAFIHPQSKKEVQFISKYEL